MKEHYNTLPLVVLIKRVAIFIAVAGSIGNIILGLVLENAIIVAVGFIVPLLSALPLFAFGELLEVTHDIRTSSEYIKQYIEEKKKSL